MSDLSQLKGSTKQIAWADFIREKAILTMSSSLRESSKPVFSLCLCDTPSEWENAEFWINNRDAAIGILKKWFIEKVKNCTLPYPEKKWEQYDAEYAHEGQGGEWCYFCKGLDFEVYAGSGNDLSKPVLCYNPETKEMEIWHYMPSIY